MTPYKFNELLSLNRPYQELVEINPNGLQQNAHVLAMLFNHEKNVLASNIVLDCPVGKLQKLGEKAAILNEINKKNSFFRTLKEGVVLRQILNSLADPSFPDPHFYFLNRELFEESCRVFKNLPSLCNQLLNPEEMNSIAFNLASQTPSCEIETLMKNMTHAFENDELACLTQSALRINALLNRLTGNHPADVFLDPNTDFKMLMAHSKVVQNRLHGYERNIANDIAECKFDNLLKIKTLLTDLSAHEDNPNSGFSLILNSLKNIEISSAITLPHSARNSLSIYANKPTVSLNHSEKKESFCCIL